MGTTATTVEGTSAAAAAVEGMSAAAAVECSSTRVIMIDHCLTKAAIAYTDGAILTKVQSALCEIPSIMMMDNFRDAKVALEGMFPAWSERDIIRVASVVYKAQGINMALNVLHLPSSWKLVKLLGSGLTSHVYLVDVSGSRLAVKTPRLLFNVNQDIYYLELLRGIDGVPVLEQKIHRMIALKPVCTSFSVETFFDCGTLALADLVETIRCAHERGIVNRDLRAANIMIGESLHNTGKIRFFILDWGFSTKAGSTTDFSGSVVTASDQVLGQLCHGFSQVAVSVDDDLVSLVRCLFLIFNCRALSVLHTIKEKPRKIICFWQQQIVKSSFWRKAQGCALQLQYDGLKDVFQTLKREDLVVV